MTAAKPGPRIDRGPLLTLALDLVRTARTSNLGKLTAELEMDGRVEVIVTRARPARSPVPQPGAVSATEEMSRLAPKPREEDVTVKTGNKSRPTTVFAGPAAWLEAAANADAQAEGKRS